MYASNDEYIFDRKNLFLECTRLLKNYSGICLLSVLDGILKMNGIIENFMSNLKFLIDVLKNNLMKYELLVISTDN